MQSADCGNDRLCPLADMVKGRQISAFLKVRAVQTMNLAPILGEQSIASVSLR